MRFLVDNSLPPRMAKALQQTGHDACHVRDLDLACADNETIFSAAVKEKRIIIAQDTDFATILATRSDLNHRLYSFVVEQNQ